MYELTEEECECVRVCVSNAPIPYDITKKNGDVNWQDGDEIDVCLAGTFAADRFIVIHNRTKSSTSKHNFVK